MAPEEETECNVAHDGLGLRSGYRGVLAGASETVQADLVSSLRRVRGWVRGTGGVDVGHDVHVGLLRGPKVNFFGTSSGEGQGHVVTDASGHVVTCLLARSCGEGGPVTW